MNRASEASEKYSRKQRKKGFILVRIWIPVAAKDRILALGKELRALALKSAAAKRRAK